MDLLALRSFHEVCRHGSISGAAHALGYTQSALSRQITGLEASLGATLLTRHARGVRPTPAGEVLREHAAAILARAERAEEEVRAAEHDPAAVVRVGAIPTAAATLLPDTLTAFAAGRPTVRVTFAEDFSSRLIPRLLDGEFDLTVVTDYPPGLPTHAGLSLRHVLDDELYAVLPTAHPFAHRDTLDLAELAEQTWVEDYAGAAAVLTGACARAGFTPRIGLECGGWLGKQAFVAAGFGVMLAPGLLLRALRADLAVCRLTDPPCRSVYAALRRRPDRSPMSTDAVDGFVAALVATAERQPTRGHRRDPID
ncbi:LysR family transcriptional regulator [Streptomyces sp. SID3343]|uniref:LysR family transcriptional regulator n=1 Tax=Streptomyces sp. SID3343 TaxID=2690260 RepID=UPI00136DDE8A|nr:LysR family transcriptional regulator [Streptomyces sp. SID3343]MYW02512.1 LysR family transcriptional regulator [Streptomyces sp. SID3343]